MNWDDAKKAQVKNSQTPHSTAAARQGSLRRSLRRDSTMPTRATRAGKNSQAALRPSRPLRKRPGPVPSATVSAPPVEVVVTETGGLVQPG